MTRKRRLGAILAQDNDKTCKKCNSALELVCLEHDGYLAKTNLLYWHCQICNTYTPNMSNKIKGFLE